MFLFSPSQTAKKGTIFVPFEMRASLGWHNNIKLYLSRSTSASFQGQQVVISPIPLNGRADLWHLAMRMKERVGLLAEITALLESKRIDILTCKAHSREYTSSIAINADIDVRDYSSAFDGTSDDRLSRIGRTLDELEAHIISQFIADLEFRPDGKPYVSLTRHHQLWRTSREADERYDTILKHGAIVFPEQLRRGLEVNGKMIWTHIPDSSRMLAILVAEPFVSLAKTFIYYENTGHISFRLTTDNRIGTLANITSRVREEGFTILQMYSRNILSGERFVTDIFARLLDDSRHNDVDLRRFVRGAFQTGPFRDVNLDISFPNLYTPVANTRSNRQRVRRGNK